MNNYNTVQGLLNSNPNPFYNPHVPPIFPEPYRNSMFNQNEVMLPLPVPSSGFKETVPVVTEPAPQPVKQKHKRRSKNEKEGRIHVCRECGKDYLSYPALYTHMKTKHEGRKPNDADKAATSKTRGRPKKVFDCYNC
jgi:hypothetical protein